jgi:hypothetical protein
MVGRNRTRANDKRDMRADQVQSCDTRLDATLARVISTHHIDQKSATAVQARGVTSFRCIGRNALTSSFFLQTKSIERFAEVVYHGVRMERLIMKSRQRQHSRNDGPKNTNEKEGQNCVAEPYVTGWRPS